MRGKADVGSPKGYLYALRGMETFDILYWVSDI
jgi:hypothetical protein